MDENNIFSLQHCAHARQFISFFHSHNVRIHDRFCYTKRSSNTHFYIVPLWNLFTLRIFSINTVSLCKVYNHYAIKKETENLHILLTEIKASFLHSWTNNDFIINCKTVQYCKLLKVFFALFPGSFQYFFEKKHWTESKH